MTHRNAPLTPTGRLKMVKLVIDEGWPQRRVAERFQVSVATVNRWVRRYRLGEEMTDRSSRPHSCPHELPTRVQRRIIKLRFTRQWGPHRIGYHLGIARSTVGRTGSLPYAETSLHRPGNRPAGTQGASATLRVRQAGRDGSRRHQETRPNPQRRRMACPWARICTGP